MAETAKPHLARVSMLSFCDLAGAERIKKTLNTGERQKEAGNINTSLLVLGRCMKAIRCNQLIKEKRKHQLVPFRESKLTRMFQSFLVGYGKASMVVNVSQAPYLFDETVQVMKFAAVTSKITVVHVPETPPTVVPNRKRKTRFSMMVDDHQAKRGSTLMGRGSIAWERPAARSTLCPTRNETVMEDTILEESVLETTVVDERYKGLNQLIDSLKDQLIKEKQKNITLEREVRTELCDEFNQMLVEVEKDWEKRLQDERERTEEVNEWRINKVQEFYRAKRKRQRMDDDSKAEVDMDETAAFRRDELEIALEEKATELECIQEKLAALEEQNSNLAKEKVKCQEDVIRLERAVEKEGKEKEDALEEVAKTKKELEVKEMSEASNSSEPIIEELKKQIEDGKAKIQKLEEEKNSLRELLDEAGEDFVEKKEELDKALQNALEQEQQILRDKVLAGELSAQLEESRMLLQDSAARMEEKEQAIAELEEQAEAAAAREKELEGKLKESESKAEQLELSLEQEKGQGLKDLENIKVQFNLVSHDVTSAKDRIIISYSLLTFLLFNSSSRSALMRRSLWRGS